MPYRWERSLSIAACALVLLPGCEAPTDAPGASLLRVEGGDAARGRERIRRHGCVACHAIPGVGGPGSTVGPPLDGFARRAYVGGVLPNTAAGLVRWLLDPPAEDPRTAMPATGLTEAEARDVAAYLYTLD